MLFPVIAKETYISWAVRPRCTSWQKKSVYAQTSPGTHGALLRIYRFFIFAYTEDIFQTFDSVEGTSSQKKSVYAQKSPVCPFNRIECLENISKYILTKCVYNTNWMICQFEHGCFCVHMYVWTNWLTKWMSSRYHYLTEMSSATNPTRLFKCHELNTSSKYYQWMSSQNHHLIEISNHHEPNEIISMSRTQNVLWMWRTQQAMYLPRTLCRLNITNSQRYQTITNPVNHLNVTISTRHLNIMNTYVDMGLIWLNITNTHVNMGLIWDSLWIWESHQWELHLTP